MTQATPTDAPPAAVRLVVCVALNASIDKIAAVDRLDPGDIHRPEILSVVPGGKALNVARAAASLGLTASAVPVLAGHAGAWIAEALAGRGVRSRPVWVGGETRTCLSILDRSTGRLTEFYEPGSALGPDDWPRVMAAVEEEIGPDPEGTVLVVSGSAPGSAPADAHARVVTLAREAGARSIVDVGGAALAAAVRARPWLAKVNEAEAAGAVGMEPGGEGAAIAAARALRAAGADAALVTRGIDGAVLVDAAADAWRIGPSPERGSFPVGSGDSLTGGLVAALADGFGLAEAARRGSAVGAANALRPGQGEFAAEDVARLLPAITLERIDA